MKYLVIALAFLGLSVSQASASELVCEEGQKAVTIEVSPAVEAVEHVEAVAHQDAIPEVLAVEEVKAVAFVAGVPEVQEVSHTEYSYRTLEWNKKGKSFEWTEWSSFSSSRKSCHFGCEERTKKVIDVEHQDAIAEIPAVAYVAPVAYQAPVAEVLAVEGVEGHDYIPAVTKEECVTDEDYVAPVVEEPVVETPVVIETPAVTPEVTPVVKAIRGKLHYSQGPSGKKNDGKAQLEWYKKTFGSKNVILSISNHKTGTGKIVKTKNDGAYWLKSSDSKWVKIKTAGGEWSKAILVKM